MIQRDTQLSWARRLEEKLRAVYATLTCGRSSDVYHHRPAQRPPRPSRPQVPLHPPPHRHEPRPRYAPPPDQPGGSSWSGYVPSPPHPDQAGGSSWQRHTPTPSPPDRTGGSPWQRQMGWHDHPQPDVGEHQQSSLSGSTWGSHPAEETRQDFRYTDWMSSMQTPPPQPTQETQYDQSHLRDIRAPRRYGWSTPPQQPPRRGRRRD